MADREDIEPDAEDSDKRNADDDPNRVGYGKPPRKHRFKPGQSGNPRGRPKGAKGLKAELRAELDEFVTITVEGKRRRIRKRRLIIKSLAAQAAKGNVAAADKLLALVIQAEGFEDQRPAVPPLSETDLLILGQFLGEPTAETDQEAEAPDE